jgi:hypothetical protein
MKDSYFTHILQVIGLNTAAITISLTEINQMLTTLSLTVAIAYTIWKGLKEFRKKD